MLRMRLRRVGKTKQPQYRVVIADQRAKRDGDFVEVVGQYNPRTRPSTLELKEDRVRHWLSQGAQPTETVHRLLHARGLTTVEPPKRVTKQSNAEKTAETERANAARAAEEAAAAAETARVAAEAERATAAEAASNAATEEADLQRAGAEAEFTEDLAAPEEEKMEGAP
jgi:small subunit ribosomal protein S16